MPESAIYIAEPAAAVNKQGNRKPTVTAYRRINGV